MFETSSTAGARPAGKPARKGIALPQIPRWIVYLVGFVPAVWVFYLAFTDQAGADPVRTLEHTLGIWALRFLIGGLAITPLRQLAGINLLRYRRAVGLLAFYYVVLHFAVYLVLDQGLDASAILADILKRPYLTFGFISFVLLVPLALTSTNTAIRKIGGKAWARLHKLVYVAGMLGVLHFIYVMKVWAAEPLIYAAILLALLGWRLVRSLRRPARPTARPA